MPCLALRVFLAATLISACSQSSSDDELGVRIAAEQAAFDKSMECPLAITVWRSLGRDAKLIDKAEDERLNAATSIALDKAVARGAALHKDRQAVELSLNNRMLGAFEKLQEASDEEARRLRNRWRVASNKCMEQGQARADPSKPMAPRPHDSGRGAPLT